MSITNRIVCMVDEDFPHQAGIRWQVGKRRMKTVYPCRTDHPIWRKLQRWLTRGVGQPWRTVSALIDQRLKVARLNPTLLLAVRERLREIESGTGFWPLRRFHVVDGQLEFFVHTSKTPLRHEWSVDELMHREPERIRPRERGRGKS